MNNEFAPARPIRSPCIGVCALDEKDLCVACRRSGMEIAEWGVLTEEQKKAVWALIRQREAEDRKG
ncbi:MULTISPECIES: DUF1289 domain-containing protein [Amphritea]|uniref:DUF1289 domain-containing protein n=2 Tax=Amphritea TaxID=515417 RepID=A0A1H9F1U4_9GAMM|nr:MULTISPECIES: DUF1289 domain-containing protein [Amphritea]MBN0986362.1 DUF1289 domain-containing protein [Amphritea pacifica]MBN1007055.1 DUF1289 domain-containing protein [Amphritea pacifica]SEQ31218.1 hypothetical protein SAMN03080615_01164 [Amphritea atlantica]